MSNNSSSGIYPQPELHAADCPETALQALERRLAIQNQMLSKLARVHIDEKTDLEDLLNRYTEAAARTLFVERASVWFFEDSHRVLRCVDLYSQAQERHHIGTVIHAEAAPAYVRATQVERVLAADDVLTDPRTREFRESYLEPLGITSMLDTPLRLGGELVGVLCLEHTGEKRHWSVDEQYFAVSLADLLSLAIESRRRAIAEEERRQREAFHRMLLERSHDVIVVVSRNNQVLYATPSIEHVLGFTSEEVSLGQVFLRIPDEDRAKVHEAFRQAELDPSVIIRIEHRIRHKDGRTLWIEVVGSNRSDNPIIGGTILNIRDITERRLMEQAERKIDQLEKELDAARTIQESILHKEDGPFASRTDLEIAGRAVPARRVGGDFFDYFLLDQHRLGVVIGDVAGKGMPAAILMAVSRTLVQGSAMRGGEPHSVLSQVNDLLVEAVPEGMFVSIFYGILDLRDGRFRYANGGHVPPFHLPAEGDVQPMPSTHSLVLGLLHEATYKTEEITIAPGDGLLLFTDGLNEGTNPAGEFFGMDRAERLLNDRAWRNPDHVVEGMLEELSIFTGHSAPNDDRTLLCVRWRGMS